MGDLGAAFTPSGWPAFVLISARLTGMVMVAPFFSMFGIPRTVRGGIVVVLALTLLPAAPHPAFPERALDIPVPLMTELVIGLGIGLVAAVIQHALVLAAEVVSLQTGLSLGQLFTASIENGGPAVAQLYGFLGLSVFIGFGGHLALVEGLGRSLTTVPPGQLLALDRGAEETLRLVGSLFEHAVQIAAPVSVAVTVTNLAMAILSRAVPQLNAMAMSFAVSIALALVLFGAALPTAARVIGRWVGEIPVGVDGVVGSLAGPVR